MAVLHIEPLLYYRKNSLCGSELHKRSDWRITALDIHWLFSDTTLRVYCKAVHTLLFGAQLRTTAKLTYLMSAYYIPNNDFTANDASFHKNKVTGVE